MYVAPRPDPGDDPLFAVRLGLAAAIGYLAGIGLQSPMPMIAPALTVGIMAGMRKAFDPKKAFGGPVAMAAMITVLAGVVELLRPIPVALILVTGLFYWLGYYLVLRTGNPIGMLVLIATALMSIMGMNSIRGMEMLRDAFLEGCGAALLIIPSLYALLPPVARQAFVEIHEPANGGHHALRAAIRAGVLLLLSLWLYTVVDASNLMLAVAGVFVMVFPTRERLFAEAWERSFATVLGGAVALAILAALNVTAHLVNLLLLVFLGSLFFGARMMHGRHPSMVYQFALSGMIALVGGALTSSAPLDATLLRVVLTAVGAVAAAFLTSLLEALIIGSGAGDTGRGVAPARETAQAAGDGGSH